MTDINIKVPDLVPVTDEKRISRSFRFRKSIFEKLERMSKQCNMNNTQFLEYLIYYATVSEEKNKEK